ncbi:MAG TPA: LamG-like jellyroll fold domain-containing protein [Opitutaceae bacterium]|nr:LamG-like jellyroll fold domain-containing protein [Opitutaceae bacterium]
MNHPSPFPKIALCLAAGILGLAPAQAALTHRYSFNDGAARDSVGKIDAKLKGAGASVVEGKLVLKNDDAASGDSISHLEFAGSVLPKSGSVSLVMWFTTKGTGPFARLVNFGASEGTEGTHFIYLSPNAADSSARAAITGSDVSSKTAVDFTAMDDGKPHVVALIVDGAAKKLRVILDGRESAVAAPLGENTLDKVKPLENWLGKSSFSADPGLNATIDEFRVYDHALTLEEAVALHQAGADALPAKPAAN